MDNKIRKGTILITLDGVRREDIFNKNLAPYIHSILNKDYVKTIKNLTVSNPYKISLPGYHEILCGHVSNQIISNDRIPNNSKTIFEELNLNPIISACLEKFKGLYNTKRSKFKILQNINKTKKNRKKYTKTVKCYKLDMPRKYTKFCKDDCNIVEIFSYYWKKNKQINKAKCGHLGLIGSDIWAHKNNIKKYYLSIKFYDKVIKYIWTKLSPENIIITTDHGRGKKENICCHDNTIPGSENSWCIIISNHVDNITIPKNPKLYYVYEILKYFLLLVS